MSIKGKVQSMVAWREIKAGGEDIASMLRFLNPWKKRQVWVETFDEAVRRVGADDESLDKTRKAFGITAFFNLTVFLIALFYGIHSIRTTGSGYDLIGFAAVNMSLFLTYYFRRWQIQHRKLGSFKEFVFDMLPRSKR